MILEIEPSPLFSGAKLCADKNRKAGLSFIIRSEIDMRGQK